MWCRICPALGRIVRRSRAARGARWPLTTSCIVHGPRFHDRSSYNSRSSTTTTLANARPTTTRRARVRLPLANPLIHASTRPRVLTVCACVACIVVCCGCACSGAFGNEGAPGGVRDNAGGQGHARHLRQKVPAPLQGHRTGTPTPTPTPPHPPPPAPCCPAAARRLLTTASSPPPYRRRRWGVILRAGAGGCRWPSWYA